MKSDEPSPRLYRALHAVVPPVINALWRPTVSGLEHVPDRGPAILASNHQSVLDVIVLPSALERPLFFLAKEEYFRGWQRRFFESVGVMPVPRDGGDAAEASLRRGQELLDAGRLLGIYPEGTRSPDGRLYRGKTGPVRLALRTGAPLVPVATVGTREVLPKGAVLPRQRPLAVRFGPPLDLRRFAGREHDRFVLRSATDELMYEIMQLSGQEYVDAYAAKVKSGEVTVSSGDPAELERLLDPDDLVHRKAS